MLKKERSARTNESERTKKIQDTEKEEAKNGMYVGLITEAFSMNKRITTTANRLADTYGIYYMFNLVICVQGKIK